MAERNASELWGMRLLFLAMSLAIIFAHILPLQIHPRWFAGPDLLLALSFAWALRRPDVLPLLLVAGVMLLADLMFQRPPGLHAALVLLAVQWLKRQRRRLRENTFAAEWLTVTAAIVTVCAGYRLALMLTAVPPGPVALAAMQTVLTVLCYPFITAAGWALFGMRHHSSGAYLPKGRQS